MTARVVFFLVGVALVVSVVACGGPGAQARPVELTVSAASHLAFAFQELGGQFEQATGVAVRYNFGATGVLAQQIEQGAPVDVFAAAHIAFVEPLVAQGLLVPDTVAVYGVGYLVLWQPEGAPVQVGSLDDLARLEVQRVAIANPDYAPYGQAAREALRSAGLWELISPKLIVGASVRQALQYAEAGHADVALVALPLAVGAGGRWVSVPQELYTPLKPALAVVASSPAQAAAREFVRFVVGPRGRAVLQEYGVLPEEIP
ncbi:MAG: molybdate ABC transporter substrate-binding protein [Ardenticatenia bacterium]|nr:molybdate ABC transporter substrate-binding protein [Ardenticatenia bacterium]